MIKDCLKHTWLSRTTNSSTDCNSSLSVPRESSVPLILTNTPDENILPNSNCNHSQAQQRTTGDKYSNDNQRQNYHLNPSDRINENENETRATNHAAVQPEEPSHDEEEQEEDEEEEVVSVLTTNDECTREEMTSHPPLPPSNQIKEEDSPVLVHEVVPQEALFEETERDTAVPLSRVENLPEERAVVVNCRDVDENEPANKRAIHILPDLKLRRERSLTPTPQSKELANNASHHQHHHHHHHQCSATVHAVTSSNSTIERQTMKTKSEMVEFDGITLSKRLIFSEEILVDERMGMVY